jgi:bifunctional non-homologous end joining protein LigD
MASCKGNHILHALGTACVRHGKLFPLRTDSSPFRQRIKDEAVTTWVKPKLVAEVKFTEWTKAGEMRHPSYLGLREDKRAEDVVQEKETHR